MTHRLRTGALAAAAALTLGLSAVPALASSPPVGKVYDCWSFTGQSAFMTWFQSVELKTHSTYLAGATRKGNRLAGNIASGRYRVHAHKLTFLSGPYAHHFTGLYHPAGRNYRPHKENAFDYRLTCTRTGRTSPPATRTDTHGVSAAHPRG